MHALETHFIHIPFPYYSDYARIWIFNLLSLGLALFFAYVWFVRLQFNYNQEGNYFDPKDSVVYHESALTTYGILSVIFLLFGLITLVYIFGLKNIRSN